MNVLLHICCAPCAIYPLSELKKEGHKTAGFFYNPNIHPYSEYLRRKAEVERVAKETGVNVLYGDYDIEEYFRHIVYNEAMKDRCPVCWWLRLAKSAGLARDNGFDAFTTTLLASPYQDHEVIIKIGEEAARNAGTKFYIKDYRSGFKEAHAEAREKGIYCQKYCGCVFSERERAEKACSRSVKRS